MSREVRALKQPCLHIRPHCQSQGSFLISPSASVKQPGHAWRRVWLRMNGIESRQGQGWRGQVGSQGVEEKNFIFSSFQSNEKAGCLLLYLGSLFPRKVTFRVDGAWLRKGTVDRKADGEGDVVISRVRVLFRVFPLRPSSLDPQSAYRALAGPSPGRMGRAQT